MLYSCCFCPPYFCFLRFVEKLALGRCMSGALIAQKMAASVARERAKVFVTRNIPQKAIDMLKERYSPPRRIVKMIQK